MQKSLGKKEKGEKPLAFEPEQIIKAKYGEAAEVLLYVLQPGAGEGEGVNYTIIIAEMYEMSRTSEKPVIFNYPIQAEDGSVTFGQIKISAKVNSLADYMSHYGRIFTKERKAKKRKR